MSTLVRHFRRHYGAPPLHLLAHIVAFFVAAWAFGQIFGGGSVINYLVWFIGAALLHDLVALPLYSVLDRIASVSTRRAVTPRGVPVINHLRAPALISAVLLLVYFPVIFGISSTNYLNDTGHPLQGYARNWLLITAGLFLVSAFAYLIRVTRTAKPTTDT